MNNFDVTLTAKIDVAGRELDDVYPAIVKALADAGYDAHSIALVRDENG